MRFPECLIYHAFRNAYYAMRFGVYVKCDSYLHRATLMGPDLRCGVSIKPFVSECLLNRAFSDYLLSHAFFGSPNKPCVAECLLYRAFWSVCEMR